MPENISKFEVLGDDKFLFALKGMPEIILKKKEVIALKTFWILYNKRTKFILSFYFRV
jgi:hypothetical protein